MRVERIRKDYQDAVIRSRTSGCGREKFFSLRLDKSKIVKLPNIIIFSTKFSGPVKLFWSHSFGSPNSWDLLYLKISVFPGNELLASKDTIHRFFFLILL